jgi:5-methylcytosine-specific restriction protein A
MRGEPRRVVRATVVHHVEPHKGDRDLFFAVSNLQSLCSTCHDGIVQIAERHGFSTEVDARGEPVDPRHPFHGGGR